MDYNGAQYAMSGVFGTNSIMQLHLVSGTVLDYMGNVVCVIGENAFPSGRLWLEITLKGAEQNAEIHLQTVGFQNMLGASYNRNGELQKFEYSVKPFIEVPDYNNEIAYGDVFKIPDVKAYDMYTLYVETTYTLYDPEGELVGTGTVGGSDAYALEKYGEYTLVFGAENGCVRRRQHGYGIGICFRQNRADYSLQRRYDDFSQSRQRDYLRRDIRIRFRRRRPAVLRFRNRKGAFTRISPQNVNLRLLRRRLYRTLYCRRQQATTRPCST